ncbi:MAG TPA: glycosyltransferase family 4 protein [Candidatus Acidoferrales bacterium]|nr:glycosyltransferase family 4 protein [Candidatus Acidoferrales bacterium]
MVQHSRKIRVLYSFPHKIGAARICYTAWQQVSGLAAAGADVFLQTGAVQRPVPPEVRVSTTIARGKFRVPYKLLGRNRALALHDHIVARRLRHLAGQIDIIHTWPLGALETLKAAQELGIPTVLERPNAHTGFAYETVQRECERLGVFLPSGHEHAFQPDVLEKEDQEYRLATRLLCPSEFTRQTFLDRGFPPHSLVRHIYGYDEKAYFPGPRNPDPLRGLTMLFVGVCAVRKGLHFALDAWLNSPAHQNGQFLIAGEFLPAYREKLSAQLAHPSVRVLGHRNDIPELMRSSDILVLPSIEEGFGLVCTEAMGSGCVPLVSEACTDICHHMRNALVHRIGDVHTLAQHIALLHDNRELLAQLRENGLHIAPSITWTAAGVRLLEIYREIVALNRLESVSPPFLAASA